MTSFQQTELRRLRNQIQARQQEHDQIFQECVTETDERLKPLRVQTFGLISSLLMELTQKYADLETKAGLSS